MSNMDSIFNKMDKQIEDLDRNMEEMKKLIEMLRDLGVTEFSDYRITVKLLPKPVNQPVVDESILKKQDNNDDEDLYWSAGE